MHNGHLGPRPACVGQCTDCQREEVDERDTV